jgi:hypothetical protein
MRHFEPFGVQFRVAQELMLLMNLDRAGERIYVPGNPGPVESSVSIGFSNAGDIAAEG